MDRQEFLNLTKYGKLVIKPPRYVDDGFGICYDTKTGNYFYEDKEGYLEGPFVTKKEAQDAKWREIDGE